MRLKRFFVILMAIVVNTMLFTTISLPSFAAVEKTGVKATVNTDLAPLNVRASPEILANNVLGQFRDLSDIIIYPETEKTGFVKASGINLSTGIELSGWIYKSYVRLSDPKPVPTPVVKTSPAVQTTSTTSKTYTLSGIVKDKTSGKIITGATVKLADKSVVTDKAGKFTLNKLPQGSYNLSISKNSYSNLSSTISINKNLSTQYTLSQVKEVTFSGTLKDFDNETPLSFVTVTLGNNTQTTDISGKFKFTKIPTNSYKLTISKTNYKKYSTTINLTSNINNLYYIVNTAPPTPKPTPKPTPTPTPVPTPVPTGGIVPTGTESERYDYIFGSGKKSYSSKEEAQSNMVNMKLAVWKMDNNGQKYSSNVYIDINKKLEKTVQAIFGEIYNDPEKFPIKSIGGWRWPDAYINHPSGTAIDINWEENAMYVDGKVAVGKYWSPGLDPYSMAADCSIVRAFRKYGWDWGGLWDTPNDYMHFSYLGG